MAGQMRVASSRPPAWAGVTNIIGRLAYSLIQPDGRQILVDEMAWADLPALYIRPVGHGAIPIGDPHRVRLGIEDISLEFTHQRALPGGVRLVQHLFVERHLVRIFELGVIAAEDRPGKVALYVEHRVRYSVAIGRRD